ncbi:retinoblastoma family protein-like [Anopheles ziemanni]|uniref:retinoblastoma family protein-like n=1 Tax=Anopheles ziemanni TaxID=345580 RepID=UPI00265DAA38|nr:retinoblastoma family protein-like [Anopheles ziemanni]
MTTAEEPASSPLTAQRAVHREICRTLNIDDDTEMRSWRTYEVTRSQYELTGEPPHWMCCSLYVACLQELPSVGCTDHYIRGNGVNITNLLRSCNIRIQEFFNKMTDWCAVTSLPTRLRQCFENLRHEFDVSMRAYNSFGNDFPRVLNEANITPDEPKRNKKAKPSPCSYNRLREFAWVLFLCVKEQHQEQRRDLTTAMNLSVCVIDLIYKNVVAEGRMDLINPSVLHPGINGSTDAVNNGVDGTAAAIAAGRELNVMVLLCNGCSTTRESVEETNRTIFLPTLSGMIDSGELKGTRGDESSPDGRFVGLVSVANFEDNFKALQRRYESRILRCVMLDERIALSLTRQPNTSGGTQRWVSNGAGYPLTPLSVKSRGPGGSRTLSGAPDPSAIGGFMLRGTLTQLMKKIQGHEPGKPRESFLNLMKNCPTSPLKTVQDRLDRLRDRFVQKLTANGWNSSTLQARFDSIEALYYLLMENIIPWEIRKRPSIPLSKVIYDMCTASEMFNSAVCVCAAEIIFFLREEQNNFPWILQVFDMQPYNFLLIIEVTVSSNSDILTPDIVNHLRRIEEQSVDSLCWKSSSMLWERMEKENFEIPSNKDVEQRAEISGITPLKGDSTRNTPNGATRGRFRGVYGFSAGPPTTPAQLSATGRQVPHPDSAKKKLFADPPSTVAATKYVVAQIAAAVASTSSGRPSSSTAAAAGSVPVSQSPSKATTEMTNAPGNVVNGNKDSSLISSFCSPQRGNNAQSSTSLNLFFRKMYHVAYVRLTNLCQNLGLESEITSDQPSLIWTIFEFTITKCARQLMRDRHLDQLLMCAIFVTIRIKKLQKTFKEIMHCYHNQPQATSAIYRSVFIRRAPAEGQPAANGVTDAVASTSTTTTTNGQNERRCPVDEMAATSVQYDRDEYGDIIKFYNEIYVQIVHSFTSKFCNNDMTHESLFLSPTPKSQPRNLQKSPRQISDNINLYVSTTDRSTGSGVLDSPNIRTYTFPASPGQPSSMVDRTMPSASRRKGETCVRSLTEPCAFDQSPKGKVRRLDKIHQERRYQKQDDDNGS